MHVEIYPDGDKNVLIMNDVFIGILTDKETLKRIGRLMEASK